MNGAVPVGAPPHFQQLAHQLGVFDVAELATLAQRTAAETEAYLKGHEAQFERARETGDGTIIWRIRADFDALSAAVENASSPAAELGAPVQVARLLAETDAALRGVERGAVQDGRTRQTAVDLAAHRLALAHGLMAQFAGSAEPAAVKGAHALGRRLQRTSARIATPSDEVADAMRDWTVPLPALTPPEAAAQDRAAQEGASAAFAAAMRAARRRGAAPGAVFVPARKILALGVAAPALRTALAAEVGTAIRTAALNGAVFEVLAAGFAAAVLGAGLAADALLAAITTPAFRAAADRGALRMAYAALSNLARPGAAEPEIASQACLYLLRRERPGPDEMELLSPAALHAHGNDSAAPVVLIAQWLAWERNRDPAAADLRRLAPQARNLVCALDAFGYGPLDRGLCELANDEIGVGLVRHLSDRRNEALELHVFDAPAADHWADIDDAPPEAPERLYGASARHRVARVSRPHAATRRRQANLTLATDCLVAKAISDLMIEQPAEPPQSPNSFNRDRNRRARGRS